MRVEDVLTIARNEVGVTEYPSGSNNVKYNTWFYGHKVSGGSFPWCMAFVQWVFNSAGKKLNTVTASCGEFIRNNQGKIIYSDYKPGDIVFFNFDSNIDADHVGIVESNDGKLVTIEGNTSMTSQDNGGAVMRRTDHGKYAICAYRPDYDCKKQEGDENMDFESQFKDYRKNLQDNDAGDWSKESREWAVSSGLIEGGNPLPNGEANYMWQDFLTREQMVTLLYRFYRIVKK